MKKEFLEEYEAKEREKWYAFLKRFRNGEVNFNETYPPEADLRLVEPYTFHIPHTKIWSQIPLYETTILSLEPTANNESFEKLHGFSIEDISRLIDFAKETGRITFSLNKLPTFYQKMDFLEPIFKEFRPPVNCSLRSQHIVGEEKNSEWLTEIKHLVALSKVPTLMKKQMEAQGIGVPVYEYLGTFMDSYCMLRALGFDSIADELITRVSYDPQGAIALSWGVEALLLPSYRGMLKEVISMERNFAEYYRTELGKVIDSKAYSEKIEFPHEVGMFLADKLKLIIPKNMEGAIELSDKFETVDLRKAMSELNACVNSNETAGILTKTKDINEIFSNFWNEADKFKNDQKFLRHGISFGFAVVGAIATMPIGGIGGLLTGLGFEVVEEIFDNTISNYLSEKIRIRPSSPLMHIFDFKKKYKLGS